MFYIIFLYVNINENKMRMRTKSFSSNTFELSQDLLRQKINFHAGIIIQKNTKKHKPVKETYFTNFAFRFIFFKTIFYLIRS